jgi:hypothetical protein
MLMMILLYFSLKVADVSLSGSGHLVPWWLTPHTQYNAWDGYYGDEMFSVMEEMLPFWLFSVNYYMQFFILIGLPLLAVWFGWRIRKNPPQDRLNLP